MKYGICVVMIFSSLTLFSQQMNIISFNIRLNTSHDGINAWPHRIEMATGLLRFHEADIFGLQEALHDQIMDIENQLPQFDWFGVGREDGKREGEYSPVFYNKSKFIVLKNETFWLSDTPEVPGKGWDAAYPRIVSWGKFQSKETGKKFLVFNTHLDHIGKEARKNSVMLIEKKLRELIQDEDLPVIITGDFNLTPETTPITTLKKFVNDSREISQEPPYGPVGTFNGFKLDADLTNNRIDYIFIKGAIDVLKYAAISDFKDQRFPSDHLPVLVKVRIR